MELLISVMILSIVSVSIFSFMIVSGRIFRRSNEEVDMQEQAQVMKNYMNDLITDTARGLDLRKKEEQGAESYEADRCLIVYGEDKIAYMAWFAESGQVRYLEKKSFSINADGTYNVRFEAKEKDAHTWPLLAEGVTSFECYLEELKEEHRIFSADLGFQMGEAVYATSHTITLRNDIFYTETQWGNGGIGGAGQAYITGITLAPGFTDSSKGSDISFTHTVAAVGDIDTSVTYLLEGNNSSATVLEDNVLHIGEDETAPMLTVICRSNVEEEISATAIVNVTSVSSIAIYAAQSPNYKEQYYYPGSVIDFTAKLEGNFISENGGGVRWELSDTTGEAKLEPSSHSSRVKLGTAMNHSVTIKAISLADPGVSREYTIYTADVEIGELYLLSESGEYKIRRGDELQLQLLVEGQPADKKMEVAWTIVENPFGGNLSIDGTGKLKASTGIPFDQSCRITVKAAVTDPALGTAREVTCMVEIEKVQISFDSQYAVVVTSKGQNGNTATNPSRVKVTVKGLNMENEEISIWQKSYVRGLEMMAAKKDDSHAVVTLNMTSEKPSKAFSDLRIALKGHSGVYEDLTVYFFPYNMFYGGRYVYIPVPGDELNLVKVKNGVPETTEEVTMNGNTYGYKAVMVNEVLYRYYVDKRPDADPKWFVQIGNELKNYRYDTTKKEYVECY